MMNEMRKKAFMNEKRAWLRILEAFIAVVIVSFVLAVFMFNKAEIRTGEEVRELEKNILREAADNTDLRKVLLGITLGVDPVKIVDQGQYDAVYNFIKARVPKNYNFEVYVCKVEDVCGMSDYPKNAQGEPVDEVFAEEAFIGADLDKYAPRKIKMFMSEK